MKQVVSLRNVTGCQRGFTMIELLVVLVILGLLAGLVGPKFFGKAENAKVKTTQTQLKMLKSALQTYKLDMGEFPSTQEGLQALSAAPASAKAKQNWQGPYLDGKLPNDGWGNPFQYRREAREQEDVTIMSFGADGKPGGEGLDGDLFLGD